VETSFNFSVTKEQRSSKIVDSWFVDVQGDDGGFDDDGNAGHGYDDDNMDHEYLDSAGEEEMMDSGGEREDDKVCTAFTYLKLID